MASKLNNVLPLSRAEKDRIEYQRLKNLGICPKCKKNKPEAGKVFCSSCLAKRRSGSEPK